MLLASTASASLYAFAPTSGSLHPWSLSQPASSLPWELTHMPGHVTGVAFPPAGREGDSMPCVVYTPGACTFVDFGKSPPPSSPEDSSNAGPKKRKRQRDPPPQVSQADPKSSAVNSKGGIRLDPNGTSSDIFRRGDFEDACLGMMYMDANKALLVECPWSRVLKTFPAPFYKLRYGS